MACSCVNKSKPTTAAQVSVVVESAPDFSLSIPMSVSVRNSRGRRYNITSPLVHVEPMMGWAVPFKVKTNTHVANGQSAREVVERTIEVYKLNGFAIDAKTAWFNCNLYWLKTFPSQENYSSLRDLISLTTPLAKKKNATNKTI